MFSKILAIILLAAAIIPAQNRNDLNNRYMLAQNYLQAGQYQKAEPLFRDLYNLQPSNYQFFQSLNQIYVQLKKYDASIALIENKMNGSAPDVNLYGLLGNTYYLKGDENKAFEIWDSALKKLPQSEVNYRVLANYALERRAFDKGIEYLKKGQDISKNPMFFGYDLATLYSVTMQYKNAAEEYCFLLSKDPNQLKPIEGKILNYIDKADALKQTLDVVKKYESDSDNISYKFLLARLYVSDKQYDNAYDLYLQIDEQQSNQGAELYNFANFLYNEGVYETSSKVFTKIINKYPDSPFISRAKLGYAKSLEASLEKSRETQVPSWKPYYKLDNTGNGEIDKVISAYLDLTKAYPHSETAYEAYLRVGEIKMDRQNDPADAEKYFHKIVDESPMSKTAPDTYIQLSDASLLQGDLNAAEKFLDDVIKGGRYPADKKSLAKYKLARIDFYRGNFGKAGDVLSGIMDNLKDDNANDALELSMLLNSSKNDSSNLVTFAKAEFLAAQKNFKEAAALYKEVAGEQQKFMLQNMAAFRYAEMELGLNNTEDSIKLLEQIADDKEKNIYADKALYLVGKIYQFGLNDSAKAVSAYENLLAKFPDSLYLDEARNQIVKLKDKIG